MTKEDRAEAMRVLSFPEDADIDVAMLGIRLHFDEGRPGYYLMLCEVPKHQGASYVDADGVEHETPRPRRCTLNVTREQVDAMLDEWVHGVKVP